ncbi:MAG: hypothetical protein LBF28_02735 [Rickettsiales bacterium]|nr:hypothetical protein [Rickettsiales bacterium]
MIYISEDEKDCCDKINEQISYIDVEYGNAEGENRDLDISLLKDAFAQISKIIDKYKFYIRIEHLQENSLTGFTFE